MSNSMKRPQRVGAILLCLLLPLLAGCDGSSSPSRELLTGSLHSSDGAPLSGYQVVYDPTSAVAPAPGTGVTTTTNGQGQFSLSVSSSQVTGSDTLDIFDSVGHLVATTAVIPGQSVGTITVKPVPPPPPAQKL